MPGVRIRGETFTDTGASITADFPQATAEEIIQAITDMTSGRASIALKP